MGLKLSLPFSVRSSGVLIFSLGISIGLSIPSDEVHTVVGVTYTDVDVVETGVVSVELLLDEVVEDVSGLV